jgi:hypothetical protein
MSQTIRRAFVMKTIFLFLTVLLILLFCTGVQAQNPPVYDDFNGKVLDPAKWFSVDSSSSDGCIVLEDGLKIKTEPLYGYRGLNMNLRAYGDDVSNTDQKYVWKQVWMPVGGNVTTMIATIQVKSFQVTACAANTTPTETRIRMGGAFFNTVASTPGNQTNAVYAFVGIGTSTDSQVLAVKGRAYQCTNADCSTTTPVGQEVDLGTTKLNKKTKLRITWDFSNNRFIFQMGRGTEAYLDYAVADQAPPSTNYGGAKRLQIRHGLANCTAARTTAALDVFIEDVMIERSP